jgi:hypothetical protein
MEPSRQALRRLSSQQSIDAHRARSPNVAEPDTTPDDNAIPSDPPMPPEIPGHGWDMEAEPIHTSLPSLKAVRRRRLELSALKPVDHHCCKNSCVCFTGYLRDLDECPHCNTPCLNPAGRPYSIFTYFSLIPQLRALYRNKNTCEKLMYRANYKVNNDSIEDIFDGERYKELKETFVFIDGEEQDYRVLEDDREVALRLSVDGMCPFKRRKNTCSPLILINYNLPPDVRTHTHNIFCVELWTPPMQPLQRRLRNRRALPPKMHALRNRASRAPRVAGTRVPAPKVPLICISRPRAASRTR